MILIILTSGVVARIPALLLSSVSELKQMNFTILRETRCKFPTHNLPSCKAVAQWHNLIPSVMALVEALVAPELDIIVDNNKWDLYWCWIPLHCFLFEGFSKQSIAWRRIWTLLIHTPGAFIPLEISTLCVSSQHSHHLHLGSHWEEKRQSWQRLQRSFIVTRCVSNKIL